MKSLILRIDDRLIHGQVLVGWVSYYNFRQIVVGNNEIVSNDWEKEMMTMKGNNFDIAVNLNEHLRTRCQHLLEMPGDTALNDSKRKKVSKKHAGSDDPGASTNLFLRVAAFDVQGRPIDPGRVPVDDIELLID